MLKRNSNTAQFPTTGVNHNGWFTGPPKSVKLATNPTSSLFDCDYINIFSMSKIFSMFPYKKNMELDRRWVALAAVMFLFHTFLSAESVNFSIQKGSGSSLMIFFLQLMSGWICTTACSYLSVIGASEISNCYRKASMLLLKASTIGCNSLKPLSFPKSLNMVDYLSYLCTMASSVMSFIAHDWASWPKGSVAILKFYLAASLVKTAEIRCFAKAAVEVLEVNHAFIAQNRRHILLPGQDSNLMKSLSVHHEITEYCDAVNRAYSTTTTILIANFFLSLVTELYFLIALEESRLVSLSKISSVLMCSVQVISILQLLWTYDSISRQVRKR